MDLAGIYIHIPFCRSRCSYCDFATGMYESGLADRYVYALLNEISSWHEIDQRKPVDTIYFGGGTPSLLTPAQIESILATVKAHFEVIPNAEVTIELNPTSVQGVQGDDKDRESDPAIIREFRQLGINRVSFGAQTFNDFELSHLGRTHTAADIRATFEALRQAGFDNINFDLIAGLPGQTMEGWESNLAQATALRPEHLSLYLLDVHEGTPLADQINRGMRPQPDDDLAADMYRVMIERMQQASYEHYEISNFCLPGCESRHNSKYWIGDPYYGFGCSAHSYDGAQQRWSNERDTLKYVNLIESGKTPIVDITQLTDNDVRAESVFLGLRLMRGIQLDEYRARFGKNLDEEYRAAFERLQTAGLIELDGNFLRLTTQGVLLSNEVFATFV